MDIFDIAMDIIAFPIILSMIACVLFVIMVPLESEAIAAHKKVIGINPEYTGAHNNLGVAYLDKGMFDEAVAEFKEASEIDPNDADVHNNLAVAYYCKGEYSPAIKYCDKAIELGYEVPRKFLKLLKPHQKNIGKVKREEKNEVDNG